MCRYRLWRIEQYALCNSNKHERLWSPASDLLQNQLQVPLRERPMTVPPAWQAAWLEQLHQAVVELGIPAAAAAAAAAHLALAAQQVGGARQRSRLHLQR
jgi:hypothetical protein